MTRHLTEDEFVLLHYGDADDNERRELEDHVAACGECWRELERVRALLTAIRLPAAEPGKDYERDVWRRLQPMLPEKRGRFSTGAKRKRDSAQPKFAKRERDSAQPKLWLSWPKWATAFTMAAVAFAAFGIGRWFERSTETHEVVLQVQRNPSDGSLEKTVRERVLWMAVGAHLDRAQRVLTELENTKASAHTDISAEQEEVDVLLPDNRLYRQTAMQLSDIQVATLLDELERLLLDISHRQPAISPGELNDVRNQIGPQGLLFKVRIAGSELRGRKINGAGL